MELGVWTAMMLTGHVGIESYNTMTVSHCLPHVCHNIDHA